MTKEWTYQEIEILRRDFPVLPCREVASNLGRTMHAVYCKAFKLGIGKGHGGTVWTKRNLKLLTDFYPIMFNKPLAKWIGVSPSSLHRKARALGLTKRPGFLEDRRKDISAMQSEALKRTTKTAGRFKPGHHGNPATEFKPGHQLTPEQAEKRAASCRAAWARRKQRDELKHYGIGVNR